MNINYEYYRIFYYAAKYQNFTRAAQILCSNQPNISRTIKLLEHELGSELFVRSNRGIKLTPEGEKLYAHVAVAVEHLETAEEELMRMKGLEEGSVTIGVSETALHTLLLPVLNQFKKMYPKIRIRISNHLTLQAIQSVKNGLVDFAVVATAAAVEKPLRQVPIVVLRDVLVGGPAFAFLAEHTVTLREISGYPMICLGENTITYEFYRRFYREHHLELKPELEAATIDQILPMIRNDLGIGFMPEILVREALEKGEVFRLPLKEKIPDKHICFVENETQPLSIAAKALKELIFQSVKI